MQFTSYLTAPLTMLTWICKRILLRTTHGELVSSTANSCPLDHHFSIKDQQILNYFGYFLRNVFFRPFLFVHVKVPCKYFNNSLVFSSEQNSSGWVFFFFLEEDGKLKFKALIS